MTPAPAPLPELSVLSFAVEPLPHEAGPPGPPTLVPGSAGGRPVAGARAGVVAGVLLRGGRLRDCTGLGPFTFHRPAYDAAVQAAVASPGREGEP